MSVGVVATIVRLAGHRDEVIATMKQTIAKVHEEDGCELYSLYVAPDRLIMIEKWASREALAAHSKRRGARRAAAEAGRQDGRAERGHRAGARAGRRSVEGGAL